MRAILFVLMSLAWTSGACAHSETAIAFWRVGDDGLSSRFYDAIRQSLDEYADIRTTLGDERGDFLLYGESHVRPLDRELERFSYRMSLRVGPTSQSEVVNRFDGHCTTAIQDCAQEVAARIAADIRGRR